MCIFGQVFSVCPQLTVGLGRYANHYRKLTNTVYSLYLLKVFWGDFKELIPGINIINYFLKVVIGVCHLKSDTEYIFKIFRVGMIF